MKHIATILMIVGLLFFIGGTAIAQDDPEDGDYQTFESGDWNDTNIWDVYSDGSWVAASAPPSGSETITILDGDSVFVNVEVTITGRIIDRGRLVADEGNLIIGDGGVYQHDQDAGNMPIAVWEEGSTFHITGVETEAPADRNQDYYHVVFETPELLSNLNMDLKDATIGGDIRVLDTGLARWYLTSADAADTAIVTLLGDVYVENGNFSVQGTSNALTTFRVHHYGNIHVTGGNFSISRGSQPNGTTRWYMYEGNFFMENATTQNSTATVGGAKFVFAKEGGVQTLTLGEGNDLLALPIEVAGDAILHMGESVLAGSGTVNVLEGGILGTALAGGLEAIFGNVAGAVTLESGSGYEFNGSVAQVTSEMMPDTVGDLIIRNPAGVTLSQETHIEGMLGLGEGEFNNAAGFTRGENFMLGTGHPDGITGVINSQLTDPVDVSEIENFAFIGIEDQVTSTDMPDIVNNLNINNPTTVTLSQPTTVNGLLRLMAGVFDNTEGVEFGPEGTYSEEGGTSSLPLSVEIIDPEVPGTFYVNQNYPNPFNPSTVIRFGLPTSTHVVVKIYNMLGQEVSTLLDEWKDAGQYEVTFDAGHLSSGVYLYRVQAGDAVTTKRMMLVK